MLCFSLKIVLCIMPGFLTPLYGCHASKISGKTSCLLVASCETYLIKSNVQEVGEGGENKNKKREYSFCRPHTTETHVRYQANPCAI